MSAISNWFHSVWPSGRLEDVEISKPFTRTKEGEHYIIDDVYTNGCGLHYEEGRLIEADISEIDVVDDKFVVGKVNGFTYAIEKIEGNTYTLRELINAKAGDVIELNDKYVLKDKFTYAIVKKEGDRYILRAIRYIKFAKNAEFTLVGDKTALKVDKTTREMCIHEHDPYMMGQNHYQKDRDSGLYYIKDDKNVIRMKHAALLLAAPVQIVACAVTMVYLTFKVLSCANAFKKARVYQHESFWKAQGRDIARIAATPFAMLAFTFAPLYGLFNPKGGKTAYGRTENFIYGQSFMASCMRPFKIGYRQADGVKIVFQRFKLVKEEVPSRIEEPSLTYAEIDAKLKALHQITI